VVRDLATRRDDELRVHFLNVGAGSCALVEFPGANNPPPMIVDCGSLAPTSNSMTRDQARTYIKNILHGRPVNVVLSHADRDHYGWISTVLEDVPVRNIWQGGDPSQYAADSFPAWIKGRVSNGAVQRQRFPRNFHNDDPIDARITGDASAFVWTVNAGDSKNGQSLVLEIVYQDFNVVFTGDAEGDTEQQVRDNYDDNVKATVMTGSHHGARTHGSNGAGWAQATSPALVIFSAGRSFGHPQCDAVRRFEGIVTRVASHPTQCGRGSHYDPVRATTAGVYVTELNGRIVLTSNGRSPFRLFCTGAAGCDAQISH
jgi:beta-lactamase superfamily II metal-dependent hydrolase